ncbi:MAG TPA: SAM-dependent methyltransferase [Kineosporiaceae bacterium]|nr:SAM-dependent methyltransferase [Kineosporiaceae bacterium]
MSESRGDASDETWGWASAADQDDQGDYLDQREWLERLDTSVVHPARRYNYWLGGKDNFAADRESGDATAAMFPTIRTAVVENRRFLRRAVTLLTQQAGIRQFLDIGTGLPSADNTHEVAQRLAPEARVVYVDHDPLVMVHARALLRRASDAGLTDYIEADLRDPDKILEQARRTLDFTRPVALMLVAILHFIREEEDPYGLVRRLIDALPSGSYLVISHGTGEWLTPEIIAESATGPAPIWFRSRAQFARFFDGLDVLEPGIVSAAHWRAENEDQPRPSAQEVSMYSAVARVP